jgi:ribokinase
MIFPVVGLGHCTLDILGIIDHYPPVNHKTPIKNFSLQGGGPVATALVTLARFGVKTALISILGNDLIGRVIIEGLEQEGINLERLRVIESRQSPVSFIAVEITTGYRNIFWTRGELPPLELIEADKDFISRAQVLHLDGILIEPSLIAAKWAKEADCRIVLDAGSVREGMDELVRKCDILIASENFAEGFTGKQNPAQAASGLKSLGPEIVVITLGERGCYSFSPEGELYIPGYKVKVVDTTGAGDVFHGAFLYGMLQGWPLPMILRFANAAAALKCTGIGGRNPIPTLEQTLSMINL